MSTTSKNQDVQTRLQTALAAAFRDARVQVGENIHYPGRNIVITSPDFAGLLPEQRFHHVVRALPADLYESVSKGFVWFELAPGEAAKAYMQMPRSDDVAKDDSKILRTLTEVKFFKTFESALRKAGGPPSKLDFVLARKVLTDAGLSIDEVTRCCLFFIRHGGHSDAQIFSHVMEELAGAHADEKPAAAKKPRGARATG